MRDTDAGVLDGDQQFDRAVGPMQFIPSTWSVVGVDSDDDGERNPQDIDDAALAAAVYLCSGSDDLSTASGQVVAVNRYNHSAAYVERVLTLMQQYLAGGYATGPTGSLPPVSTNTVAAGRIDGLHPDEDGRPGGSLSPAKPPPPNPSWQGGTGGMPPDDDTDIETPTDPGGPVEPPPVEPPPAPTVVALPPAPVPIDPCGPGNAGWVLPANSKGLTWSDKGGRLVLTITDRSVFADGTRSHDFGVALDSGAPCVIAAAPGEEGWPLQPGGSTPWSPGKAEQAKTLSLDNAVARCLDEGFVDGTRDYLTCLAFYAAPSTPGAPYPGQPWLQPAATDPRS